MTRNIRSNFQFHPYHLVSPSPWPLYTSISLGNLGFTSALSMHNFYNTYILWYISLILVIASMSLWFRDVIAEGKFF
jgi:cytochrome c oxidase subunit 3